MNHFRFFSHGTGVVLIRIGWLRGQSLTGFSFPREHLIASPPNMDQGNCLRYLQLILALILSVEGLLVSEARLKGWPSLMRFLCLFVSKKMPNNSANSQCTHFEGVSYNANTGDQQNEHNRVLLCPSIVWLLFRDKQTSKSHESKGWPLQGPDNEPFRC